MSFENEFHEVRPVFAAVQFDGGVACINEMRASVVEEVLSSRISMEQAELPKLFIKSNTQEFNMKRGDWLVRTPQGDVQVVSEMDFRRRFEKTI